MPVPAGACACRSSVGYTCSLCLQVRFHEELPRLLRPGGVYSFFNGLCPFNHFFQGVACQVVQDQG